MGVKTFLYTWLSPYAWVLGIRHFLYDSGMLLSREFPNVPVICVGNMTVGGTGKTPMTEYLVEWLLQQGKRPMVLSRGYGRKTKGFHYVEPHEAACQKNGYVFRENGNACRETDGHILWGDEPLQIKYRFPNVVVAVCEDRVAGVERLLTDYPEDPWIILDDALQHRRLKPSGTVLMANFHRPFWKDRLLPFGRLRDLPSAVKRADCVVLTHCPFPLPEEQKKEHIRQVKQSATIPVFHTYMTYGAPVPLNNPQQPLRKESPVLLVTGVADAAPLRQYVQTHYKVERHLNYPDHHIFSQKTLKNHAPVAGKSFPPADYHSQRCRAPYAQPHPGWVIPIKLQFFPEETAAAFSQLVLFEMSASEQEGDSL